MSDLLDTLFDAENSDNITLYNEDDKPVEFVQIAVIPLGDVPYVILQPVDYAAAGLAEDEAVVFAVLEEDGEAALDVVTDDSIIDAVFAEYEKLLAE